MAAARFDALLAVHHIRAKRDDNSISDGGNARENQDCKSVVSPEKGTDPKMPPPPNSMSMKDVKAIHAAVQAKLVNAGRSRGPVTLGELIDVMVDSNRFDPVNHPFKHLPPSFFLTVTAAQLQQNAWAFIASTPVLPAGSLVSSQRITNATGSENGSASRQQPAVESFGAPRGEGFPEYPIIPTQNTRQDYGQDKAGHSGFGSTTSYNHPEDFGTHPFANNPYVSNSCGTMSKGVDNGAAYSYCSGPYTAPQETYNDPTSMYNPGPYAVNDYGASPSFMSANDLPLNPHVTSVNMQVAMYSSPNVYPSPPLSPAALPLLYFSPSRYLRGEGRVLRPTTIRKAQQIGYNLHSRYKADITDDTFRNATCPEWLNTSVHVEGFPPNTSEAEIFAMIRVGKVRGLAMQAAAPPRFSTAAADITFFTREAAEEFMWRGQHGFYAMRGNKLWFKWNKNSKYPAEGDELLQSRVLLFEGPEHLISLPEIEFVLKQFVSFDPVNREEWTIGDGMKAAQISMKQVVGQARMAKRMYEEYIVREGRQGVFVSYGIDPCGS